MDMEQTQSPSLASGASRRMSIFAEVGLLGEEQIREERRPIQTHGQSLKRMRPAQMLRFRSRHDIINESKEEDHESDWESVCDQDDADVSISPKPIVPASYAMSTKLYRLSLFSVILALLLPLLQLNPMARFGVRADTVSTASIQAEPEHSLLLARDNSPTDACKRWSGQTAVVNGTLYMYGFRTTTDSHQTSNTWSKSEDLYFCLAWLFSLDRNKTNSRAQLITSSHSI